jgi:glycosyltransferase involved in cell wall biosynthesis
MTELFGVDKKYSTTRLLTREQPIIENKSEDKLESVLFLPEHKDRLGEGGLRTQGYFKTSQIDKPLITVVTVVYNGEQLLEDTIHSVINQTYDNVEYIIIDGGSTDGTIDIIHKYQHAIDYWVSEKDLGIYDAMNKAIDLAGGVWINFMNAGDAFYNKKTLHSTFKATDYKDYGVIYGDVEAVYPHKRKEIVAGSLDKLWRGSQFSHQSTFILSSLNKKIKYNIMHKIGADFEFFYQCKRNGIKFFYVNEILAKVSSGGLSDNNHVDTFVGFWNVIDKNTGRNIFYISIIVYIMFKLSIKKSLKLLRLR